jgi:hypothetical protein
VIKIISYVLIVFGVISGVLNFFGIFIDIGTNGSDSHNVHYSGGENARATFLGTSDIFIRILDLVQNALVILQGWFGVKATDVDTVDSIRVLIRRSLILLAAHVVLMVFQMVIGASAVAQSEEE